MVVLDIPYHVRVPTFETAYFSVQSSNQPVRFCTTLTINHQLNFISFLQTWKDSAQLAEVFEAAKTRSVSDSFASLPRAPGNEVTAVKVGSGSGSGGGGSSSSNGSAPSSPRSPRAAASAGSGANAGGAGAKNDTADKGYVNKPVNGKLKWTCACCKNLVSTSLCI